ncbi:MAG: N-6 DNA methylase [Rickettsiales bacterium]|jgi:type I restriction-modification system DNA methylase subunit|nr:N-6 DNA methylase [Rickettsiales bacterium]
MSEELLQRDLIQNPEKIGKWDFRNIGNTSLSALKNSGIIPKKDYKSFERRKPDGIITSKKEVIAIIENKSVSKFKTDKQKQDALKQGLDVAQALNAKILILTDRIDTVWINAFNGCVILDEKGRPLKENFDYKNQDLEKLIEQIINSIDKDNSQIREPRLKDPTKLAKSVWQDLWMAAGATPENCLYSFVELFIFKYLSDLGVLKEHLSYDFIMKMFEKEDENIVLKYYADNVRKHIKKDLFPTSSEDNTTIINGTIFVSKDDEAVDGFGTVFHKILKKFGDEKEGGGELRNIDKDFKSKLFETFLKESISKKNWGQYFTPLKVVRAIVGMAKDEIKEGIRICDPACGVGKFLLESLIVNNNIEHFYEIKNKKIISKISLIGKDKGFDKEEQKTIILAKANMLIYMSDLVRKHSDITPEFSKLFNETFELKTKNILGTLRDVSLEGSVDLILTNPPYVTIGSSNLKEEIVKCGLQSNYKINAMGVEGLFMEWIIRALKPNGKAFVVVPDGIFNRQNDKNLRKFIADECYIDGIISLPLNTFFTTNKKTYILCLTKKTDKNDRQNTPVFTYLVSEIGEGRDVNRFDIEQDDLSKAVALYSFFKGNKTGFEKINTDKRCKIFLFPKFLDSIEQSWIIDKWWTEEEKIELGISEKKEKVGLLEFSTMIEDMALSINAFQEEIRELAEKKKPDVKQQVFMLNELFDVERGKSKYTKKYGDSNRGIYPVYSASNNAPLASINTFDFDGRFLTWATNGFAGYVMLIDGKFSINADRGLLRPKRENINLQYVKTILEPKLRCLAKGRKGEKGEDEFTKVYPSMIGNIEIPMFINAQGEFDMDKQNEIAEKHEYIAELRVKIDSYKKQIEELYIEVGNDRKNFTRKKIKEIFDLHIKTNNSQFTKAFINQHKGYIPVYSASKFPDTVDYGYVEDNLPDIKYFENCLTWNIDGSIGKVHFRAGRFSLSEKVIPLIVHDLYKDKLDLSFLKYVIEIEFGKHYFGYDNKAGKGKIQNIEIAIPVKSDGEFDLSIQRQISDKYRQIEQIKKNIVDELDTIYRIEVDYA